MSVLGLVVLVALVGLIVGLARQAPWIDDSFKQIIWWVGIVAVIIAVLYAFGVMEIISDLRVPRIH